LQSVRAGLLDQAGVREPAAGSHAVTRTDPRDLHRLLHAPHVVEVFVRAEHKGISAWKESDRLGESIVVTVPVVVGGLRFASDLFLEKRAQNDRRGARVLELSNGIEIVAQRRSARD